MFSRRKDKNMKSKDYAKTGTYYLVGNLFNKGIAFLTIIIYTRILTAYDYGIINTFSSWVGILSMILGMSLQNSIRVAFVDFKEKIDDLVDNLEAVKSETDEVEQCKMLSKIFGDDFPIPEKKR